MAVAAGAAVGAGWEYLHVAIDDHSRIAFSRMLPDSDASLRSGFLARRPGILC